VVAAKRAPEYLDAARVVGMLVEVTPVESMAPPSDVSQSMPLGSEASSCPPGCPLESIHKESVGLASPVRTRPPEGSSQLASVELPSLEAESTPLVSAALDCQAALALAPSLEAESIPLVSAALDVPVALGSKPRGSVEQQTFSALAQEETAASC